MLKKSIEECQEKHKKHSDTIATLSCKLAKAMNEERDKILDLEKVINNLESDNCRLADELKNLKLKVKPSKRSHADETLGLTKGETKGGSPRIVELEQKEKRLKEKHKRLRDKQRKIRELSKQNRESRLCVVCQERRKSHVLTPCWHFALCARCSKEVDDCPMCRQKIHKRQRVFEVEVG